MIYSKRPFAGLILLFSLCATAAPSDTSYSQNPDLVGCNSSEVYKNTYNYLKKNKELPFNESQLLKAALEINKGCNGADKRFKRIFELLVKSGVSIRKCYELAVDFAQMKDQKADNFAMLFKGLFLENKFDLDFETAYKASLQLSAALPKDWEKVRTDFHAFLNYCADSKGEEVPLRTCAEWTLALLKHEDQYPLGIFASFKSLNSYLQGRRTVQLPVKDRLNLIREILAYGPKAPVNFQSSLDWLGSKAGPGLPPQKAHMLALEIAKNTLRAEFETETEKSLRP